MCAVSISIAAATGRSNAIPWLAPAGDMGGIGGIGGEYGGGSDQGSTLVYFSAQRKHCLWYKFDGFNGVLLYRRVATRHKLDTERLTEQNGSG